MGNKPAIPLIVVALVGTTGAGCSRRKPMDSGEVRSELRSARSLTAEAETFIDFVLQGRATRSYAEGQAAYLENELERSSKELDEAIAEPDAADALRNCQRQLHRLIQNVSVIRRAIGDSQQLRQIRESLDQAKPDL